MARPGENTARYCLAKPASNNVAFLVGVESFSFNMLNIIGDRHCGGGGGGGGVYWKGRMYRED